ncbi:hypothetical protein [Bacillus sp. RS11]|uniref:hypothetical protein n=1 Tax=Lysinibacillus sp. RS11 TaxID=3242682 RepID=UPI0035C6B354
MSNIKKLEAVTKALEDLCNSTPENPLSLIKTIEKATRLETGSPISEFLSNPDFIQKLINVGYRYESDEKVVEQVLWSLGQISDRVFWSMRQLYAEFEADTQNIYNFFLQFVNHKNNKIRLAVAAGLVKLPQFEEYSNKWNYIISIASIPPKIKSMRLFRWVVKGNIKNIPNEFKYPICKILKEYLYEINLDIDTQKLYKEIIIQLDDNFLEGV